MIFDAVWKLLSEGLLPELLHTHPASHGFQLLLTELYLKLLGPYEFELIFGKVLDGFAI